VVVVGCALFDKERGPGSKRLIDFLFVCLLFGLWTRLGRGYVQTVCLMVWTSLDPASGGLWGWESWSLWLLAWVVRGRWIGCGKEGGTGKPPRTLVKLSASPLLRLQTKLSPWPRLLHKRCITRRESQQYKSHTIHAAVAASQTPSKPLPCFCCTTSPPSQPCRRGIWPRRQRGTLHDCSIFTQKVIDHFSAAPIYRACNLRRVPSPVALVPSDPRIPKSTSGQCTLGGRYSS
jgi:hypothetical protein